MENKPLISVIVPVYKVEQYLPRCVDSLLRQTYENLEIILVDDGSPDRCGEICEEYARRDSRIRVIHKENGGLSSARNAGIDVARGEYLGFVDSDDWIEPETYALMAAMAMEENVSLVCAGRFNVTEDGAKTVGLCPPRRETISGEELVSRIFRWDHVDSAAWDKLYHSSLFRGIRYPLGKICEDVPTTYRLALAAGKAGMLNRPVYNYFQRSGSITLSAISEKTFHFPENAAQVYADVCQNYPGLKNSARYLLVRCLGHTLQVVELAGEDTKKRFAAPCAALRRQLWQHIPFFLTSTLFTLQEKATWLLMCTGGYMFLRRLRHPDR